MRKLKLQMQLSLDGAAQFGEADEQQWVTWAWEEIRPYVLDLQRSCDTQVTGRKLAVDYFPYWFEVLKNPADPMHEIAEIITGFRNLVFSKTLETADWPGVEIASGDLAETVNRLKSEPGRDIMVVGGTSFVASLVEAGLVDEFHLFVNPVALGKKGVSIFEKLDGFRALKLRKTTAFDCGIVLLHYEKAG